MALEKQYLDKKESSEYFDQAVERLNQALPGYNQAKSFLDRKLAESLNSESPELAQAELMKWERDRGGTPVQAIEARKKVVDQYRDELRAKYPDLPESFYSKYSQTPANLDQINYSNLGDRKNPYAVSRQEFVDGLIERNYRS